MTFPDFLKFFIEFFFTSFWHFSALFVFTAMVLAFVHDTALALSVRTKAMLRTDK